VQTAIIPLPHHFISKGRAAGFTGEYSRFGLGIVWYLRSIVASSVEVFFSYFSLLFHKQEKAAWYLLTNLPDLNTALEIYAQCFGIEAMLKDCSST
jgi:hypothetical protein